MTSAAQLVRDAHTACDSWSSNKCHFDNGNYRLNDRTVPPWNRSARLVFRGCDELHSVSQKTSAERDRWIEARVAGVDTLRIDKCALREARQTLQCHALLIKLAIEARGSGVEPGDAPETVVAKAMKIIDDGWRPTEPWAEVSLGRLAGTR